VNWLGRFFRKSKLERQLDSELRFHVEQQSADNIAAGMSPDEARGRALAQFGGLEYIKEETREARGTRSVESLLQDIRFALRMFRKSRCVNLASAFELLLADGWVRFPYDLILLVQSLVVPSCTHEGMSADERCASIAGVCRG
jgi:putative ABC transport system permease protein